MKRKETKGRNKRKYSLREGVALPPLLRYPSLSSSAHNSTALPRSSLTPYKASPGILPTLVSRRKSRRAGVGRGSRKRRRTDGALGPLSHSASTLRHSSLISGVHLWHRLKRWSLVCLSPEPHHQQSSLVAWPIFLRCGAVAACHGKSCVETNITRKNEPENNGFLPGASLVFLQFPSCRRIWRCL